MDWARETGQNSLFLKIDFAKLMTGMIVLSPISTLAVPLLLWRSVAFFSAPLSL
jgi:hypothetical protein